MIIKCFRKEGFGFFGQNIESWTKSLNEVEDIVDFSKDAQKGYLSTFFKKYFPYPPEKILDGGCGQAKYVIAYRKLGYDIIGVDFSKAVLTRIKKEVDIELPIYAADITTLPFKDALFDCYYSGGVIEHFEDGPGVPLKEARRVLKKGGVLLATVPYINILRRIYLSIFSTKKQKDILLKKCRKCEYDAHPPKGYKFCEYWFDVNSLIPYFKTNGFLIEKTYPTNFVYGEIGLLIKKIIAIYEKQKKKSKNKTAKTYSIEPREHKRSIIKRILYDFLITENRDNIFLRLPLTLLNYLSSHLVLFVARAV